jgi:hypothetical protein
VGWPRGPMCLVLVRAGKSTATFSVLSGWFSAKGFRASTILNVCLLVFDYN